MVTNLPTIRSRAGPLSLLLAFATLTGLVLRVAAAQGDYWLDEAWSAVFARDAGTPGRVLFAINHDNNHYLNTLWLQLVGWGAPPMLGRALSIACGTAAVAVAGLIGARRGLSAAALTALLFAVSPILVTYGSEARGYAPMLLALLTAIAIVDRHLAGDPPRHAGIWLGLVALLGMLAHLSMLFGIAALIAWQLAEQTRRLGLREALLDSVRLMGRAALAAAAVPVLVLIAAAASSDGLRMGSLAGFSWAGFVDALAYMVAFAIGWPFAVGPSLALVLLPLAIAAARASGLRDRMIFYLIAILGLPLLVALLQPDNSAFPRYYLLSATGLLLFLGDRLATAKGWWAWSAGAALVAGGILLDVQLIANRRGDPGGAVATMAAMAPGGATVLIDNQRDRAVLEAAAAHRGYWLDIAERCTDAGFLFVEPDHADIVPPAALRCGTVFRPAAIGEVRGLSGMEWRLYERAR